MNRPINTILVAVFLAVALSKAGFPQANEQITITTYYPSPYGSYAELRAQKMAIGDNYSGSDYCWGAPGDCLNVINTNADLLVEGNVGIGTTDPKSALVVADLTDPTVGSSSVALAVDKTYPGVEVIHYEGGSGLGHPYFAGTDYGGTPAIPTFTGAGRDLMALIGLGRTGDGRAVQAARIEFRTTKDFSAMPYNTDITFSPGGGALTWDLPESVGSYHEAMRITSAGNVGIGRIPSGNRLEVEGDAFKTGGTADWLIPSDRRIKTDIRGINSNASEVIKQLRPVKFRYTKEYRAKHNSLTDKYYYNFIGQEFQKVFPDSVKEDAEGFLQIDTHNVRVYLVAAAQEIIKNIGEIKAENNALKEKNTELETRIKALEAKISSKRK